MKTWRIKKIHGLNICKPPLPLFMGVTIPLLIHTLCKYLRSRIQAWLCSALCLRVCYGLQSWAHLGCNHLGLTGERDPLLSSHGCWKDPVLCKLWTEGLSFSLVVGQRALIVPYTWSFPRGQLAAWNHAS